MLADTLEPGHGFVYSDGVMRDLNSLIDPASGWTIQNAWDINDRRQILAFGCRAGDCTALLLSPAGAGQLDDGAERPQATESISR